MTPNLVHTVAAVAARMPPTAPASAATPAPPPLLPKPTTEIQGAQSDFADLYKVLCQMRDQQASISKGQVDNAQLARDAAAKEQEEALQRARDAASKGGVLDWIAKDVGLAGAVGLVTFNYGLVAADVAAHKLGLLQNLKIDAVDVGALATGRVDVLAADALLRKTDLAPADARALLARCGVPADAPGISDEDIKPVAKKLLMANLFVAGLTASVLSGGSAGGICVALAGIAISEAGSYVAKEGALDGVLGQGSSKWIGFGMEAYGALACGMSGLAPGAPLFGQGARIAAGVATGADSVLKGTEQVVTAVHDKEAADATIDGESAKQKLGRIDRLLDLLVDGMKELQSSHQKATEAVRGAMQTANETQVALSQGIRV